MVEVKPALARVTGAWCGGRPGPLLSIISAVASRPRTVGGARSNPCTPHGRLDMVVDLTELPIVRLVLVGATAISLETSKHTAMIDFAMVGHTSSPTLWPTDKNLRVDLALPQSLLTHFSRSSRLQDNNFEISSRPSAWDVIVLLPPLPVSVRTLLFPRLCRKKTQFSRRYRKQRPSTLLDTDGFPQIQPVIETKRLSQPPPEAEQTVAITPKMELSDTTPADDDGAWVFFVGNVSVDCFPHETPNTNLR